MSVDDRIRSGLAANALIIEPDVEALLSTTLTRYRRRRALRWASVAALAAAACTAFVLAVLWHGDPTPPPPLPARTTTTHACSRLGDGGKCLDALAAGTYHTQLFQPSIQYTVPDGWRNDQDLKGNFLLTRQQDDQNVSGGTYLGIYQNVAAADIDCYEMAQPDVGQTPQALVAWFRTLPKLVLSAPKAVTVGGLHGYQIDIDVAKGNEACTFGGGRGTPLITGGGVSGLHHVVASDIHVRLVILGWKTGNVTLEITSAKSLYPGLTYPTLVQPIINSLKFGP
jgi:hypothetical protein